MTRQFLILALATTLCLPSLFVHGAQRGKQGEKPRGGSQGRSETERKPEGQQGEANRGNKQGGNKQGGNAAPGGQWSERSHGGKPSNGQTGVAREQQGSTGVASPQAAGKNKSSQATGAQGAAAGAAAANRNQPQATGAQGAAAGAAAANRNQPKATGAEGAAAGAAAVNRNQPKVSGAEGAAAGAAAANRNAPQVSGAQGAALGAAAANRNAPAVNGAAGAAAGYAAVRNSFNHPDLYGQQWYGNHPGVWAPSGWAAGAAWVPVTWATIAATGGYGNAPISYNYGENVVAQNGNVIVNGQSVGTTQEYSQQAYDLAASGANAQLADDDTWYSLGVFAMVRNEQQEPQLVVQLAINKQGILRGNYTDEVTDHTLPIQGAVDKQTQRAAWTVGSNTQSVMEAGLSDLADGEAPTLIHKNGKTDHWLLIRLDQPNQNANGAGTQ